MYVNEKKYDAGNKDLKIDLEVPCPFQTDFFTIHKITNKEYLSPHMAALHNSCLLLTPQRT